MIGLTGRDILATAIEFASLGPIWPGIVLRGVRVVLTVGSAFNGSLGLVMSQNGQAAFANFNSGRSLVIDSDVALPGVTPTVLPLRGSGAAAVVAELPVYAPVREGPYWVIVRMTATVASSWILGLVVEPERLVRPAIERGVAARREVDDRRVIAELRREAEAAAVG